MFSLTGLRDTLIGVSEVQDPAANALQDEGVGVRVVREKGDGVKVLKAPSPMAATPSQVSGTQPKECISNVRTVNNGDY